jgi:hypothetical protein
MAFPKDRFTVGDGLFAYRVVVLVALYEPSEEDTDHGTIEATHFARTYGITASSYAEAVEVLERASGRSPDEMSGPAEGYVDEIEISMMDPSVVAEELGDDVSYFEEGVHFCSEPLFFTEADLDDDEEDEEDEDEDGEVGARRASKPRHDNEDDEDDSDDSDGDEDSDDSDPDETEDPELVELGEQPIN